MVCRACYEARDDLYSHVLLYVNRPSGAFTVGMSTIAVMFECDFDLDCCHGKQLELTMTVLFKVTVDVICARRYISTLCLLILSVLAAFSPPIGFNDPKSWAVDLVNPCVASPSFSSGAS
jgi:hypothetical protein